MKKIKLLILIVGIFAFLCPSICLAKAKNYTNGVAYPSECANKTKGDKACKTKAASINITAYDLDTTVHSTVVNPRKITISGASDVTYKVIVLDAQGDRLDKLRFKKDKELTINQNIENLEDTVSDLNGVSFHSYKVKNGKKRDGAGDDFSYTLSAGHEAVVIALVGSHPSSGEKCNSSADSETMKCKMGQITKIGGADDIKLSGTASFAYFQNPTGNSLIANIKGLRSNVAGQNKACDLASKGKYMTIDEDDKVLEVEGSKYSLTSAELGDYGNLMYNKVLGNFCNSDSFAFLLTDKQIRNVSNAMLRVYHRRKNTANTYDSVNQEINRILSTYNISLSSQPKVNQSCEKEGNYEIGEHHYLYKDEKEPVYTGELSNHKNYPVCKSVCYEHLTLNYSPPVASKAGLCFSYKVTVKSEMDCGVKYYDDYLNALITKDACAPTAVCGSTGTSSQAGPNDEFDSCIKECDGGNYSQSCINKCYKKVYSKKSDSKDIVSNDSMVTNTTSKSNKEKASLSSLELTNDKEKNNISKVAKIWNNDTYLDNYYIEREVPDKCKTSHIMNNLDECAKFYYIAKSLKPMGEYDFNSEGEIIWKNKSGISKDDNVPMQVGRSAPMYFRSIEETKNTLRRLYGKWSGNPGREYRIDDDGFLRQWNSTYKCNMVCRFTGCNKSDAMSSVDYVGEATSSVDYVGGATDDLDKIEKALEKCQTSAVCGKTKKESEFEIKIDTPLDSDRSDDKKENANVTAKGKTIMQSTDGRDVTIIPSGTCHSANPSKCNKANNPYEMFVPADVGIDTSDYGIFGQCYDGNIGKPHYQTTWTFPGSWINLKSGETIYSRECNVCDYYERRGFYCLPYNTSDVNVNWWKWKMTGSTGNAPNPEISNNIRASANDFGEYKWRIDLSCFYAIYNETVPVDDPNCISDGTCPPIEDDGGESTRITNYKFKIYDPSEPLFDDDEEVGYNWTTKAKINPSDQATTAYTEKEKTYFIDPADYAKEISEGVNQKYESEKDAEYYFELSKDNMKDLKNRYKNQSYTSYSNGSFIKEELSNLGMACYYSDFVTEVAGFSTKGKRPNIRCVNNAG